MAARIYNISSHSACQQQFSEADRFPAKEGNLFYQAEPCFLQSIALSSSALLFTGKAGGKRKFFMKVNKYRNKNQNPNSQSCTCAGQRSDKPPGYNVSVVVDYRVFWAILALMNA